MGAVRPFFLFSSYVPAMDWLGRPLFFSRFFSTHAEALCNVRFEGIEPLLVYLLHTSAFTVSSVEQPGGYSDHVQEVEHQPVVPFLGSNFVAV